MVDKKKKTKKKPAKPPKKNKGGRPKKVITKKLFEELCKLQCSKEEICDAVGINEKTLTRWCKETYNKGFYEVFKIKRGKGKMSLRRTGFKLSETNAAVWIFLAKNMLGMTDKPLEDADTNPPTPVTVNINVQDCSKPKEKPNEF